MTGTRNEPGAAVPRAPYGLVFESSSPVERSEHLRADVALFVGYVAPRRIKLAGLADERHIRDWLRSRGFETDADALERDCRSVATLTQMPVPVDSWGAFARLFAWDARPGAARPLATYLGAAVRAFFAQGGARAYVVRADDPWPALQSISDAQHGKERLRELVPDPDVAPPTALDRKTWRGISHLFGLDDVSFVLVPDLPDLFDAVAVPAPREPPGEDREVFVTCAEERTGPASQDDPAARTLPPACDTDSLHRWAAAVAAAASFVRRHRPEAMFVAAVPLLLADGPDAVISAESPLRPLVAEKLLPTRPTAGSGLAGLASAFVQLAAPWVKTAGEVTCPGAVEPPDGTVAGLLARNARARGTFRSAAGLEVPQVYDLSPCLGRAALLAPIAETEHALVHRITVLGRAPGGVRLLSDVTTSLDEGYRSAGASRLIGAILRAARVIGEDLTFEVSSETLWARVRRRFEDLMLQLWETQALRGRTPDEAFEVRCDRTTTTTTDHDAGRVIVELQFEAAVAIESLRVTLSLSEGGRVALQPGVR